MSSATKKKKTFQISKFLGIIIVLRSGEFVFPIKIVKVACVTSEFDYSRVCLEMTEGERKRKN